MIKLLYLSSLAVASLAQTQLPQASPSASTVAPTEQRDAVQHRAPELVFILLPAPVRTGSHDTPGTRMKSAVRAKDAARVHSVMLDPGDRDDPNIEICKVYWFSCRK